MQHNAKFFFEMLYGLGMCFGDYSSMLTWKLIWSYEND